MSIGRTFWKLTRYARAARFWVLLAFAALAFVGFNEARAQSCPKGGGCDKPTAYAACQAQKAAYIANYPTNYNILVDCKDDVVAFTFSACRRPASGEGDCAPATTTTTFHYYYSGCPAGTDFNPETGACEAPCSNRPTIPGNQMVALGPEASFCYDGCRYTGTGFCLGVVIDNQEKTVCDSWQTEPGATCSVGESPAPVPPTPDSDGDGISDENDLSPNNPGVGNADGQEPSRACGGPGQPECLPDGSNEGSGRGNTSSGGGDCNTPPRSSGDAILAQIAFQTWATRCAVTAAANQFPGSGSGGGDGGDGDGSEMDKLRNEAAGLDTSLGEGDAEAAWIEAPSGLDLDTGGLGIGGTCPAPPTINGVSIDPDNNLCMLVQIIGSLVLVGAFAHAGYIIGRA